jgi:nucleotide-binding universal stress UspA family protein
LKSTKEGLNFKGVSLEEKVLIGDPMKKILSECEGHDLLILGVSRQSLWRRLRFGTIPEKIMRRAPIPVLVVRKYEGPVKSWLRRFLAG